MSYQVLARKYRPKFFHEMVGQEHVLQSLIHALDHQRLHHAYLFTGTRGVGKTTTARILAKCLNCEQGVTSKPCGTCHSCTEINEGRFVDLIEVDAASRTKVEDTRELLDNVPYAPTAGRFKVYLIDEVHMLSTHSFNALLKTLEEPPGHVKFLLATTDPQKVPVTILSRCLQFSLKNMPQEKIVHYLSEILRKESVDFDEQALWYLARAADGSMRDALSLTDQAISHGGGRLEDKTVCSMLGGIDRGRLQSLFESLLEGNAHQLISKIRELAEFSPDYDEVIANMLDLLHRVSLIQWVPELLDNSLGDKDFIQQIAQKITPEELQLFYQISLNGRKDLPLSPDPQMGFEMLMLRMLAFKPVSQEVVSPVPSEPPQVEEPPPTQSSSDVAKLQSPPDETLQHQSAQLLAEDQSLSQGQNVIQNAQATPAEAVSMNNSETLESNANPYNPMDVPSASLVEEKKTIPPHNEKENVSERDLENEQSMLSNQEIARSISVNDQAVPTDDEHHHVDKSTSLKSSTADVTTASELLEKSFEQRLSEQRCSEQHSSEQKVHLSDIKLGFSNDEWLLIQPDLSLSGMAQNIAANCIIEEWQSHQGVENRKLLLGTDTHHIQMASPSLIKRMTVAISEYLSCDVLITLVETNDSTRLTPAKREAQIKASRQEKAENSIHQDPNILMLVKEYDGTVLPNSIQPKDESQEMTK